MNPTQAGEAVKLSRDEFMDKYGHVLVRFHSYWKYTFSFKGSVGDAEITCGLGGNADDIYRESVGINEISIHEVQPYCGEVRIDGQIVESFYDY